MHGIEATPLGACREPFNSGSHLLGAVVFAALTVLLVRRGSGNWRRSLSLALLGVSTVSLLTLSSLYHCMWPGPLREFFLRADVAGIFLLTAGSLTPVHAILCRGMSRWLPLTMFWSGAAVGIIHRLAFFDQVSDMGGVLIFLAFGWGAGISAVLLWRAYGWQFIQNGIGAGMCYTIGAAILLLHPPALVPGVIGPHEIWHALVLIGLSLHWSFVFQFAHWPMTDDATPATIAFPQRRERPLRRAA